MSETAEHTAEWVTGFNEGYSAAKEDANDAFAEIERLRLATGEGSLAQRSRGGPRRSGQRARGVL